MQTFLHAADLHVDSPLEGLDRTLAGDAERLRGATRRALENLVATALAERVAFVLLAGDIWYERPAAARFLAWLEDVAASGVRVIVGDPGRAYVPEGLALLAALDVPTSLDLEGRTSREVRVLEIGARGEAGSIAGR